MCSIPKLFRLNFAHGTQLKVPMVKMTNRNFRLAINLVLKKANLPLMWSAFAVNLEYCRASTLMPLDLWSEVRDAYLL